MAKGGGLARLTLAAVVAALALPASAFAGHGLEALLDHDPPTGPPPAAPNPGFQSGGRDAEWELVGSIPTGNPHSDLDFFEQGGNTYASVGTLGTGGNGGGQTIVQLTEGDRVAPRFVTSEPTASCISQPDQALGLQHDVEATPKGNAILNTDVLAADRTDTQLLIDATDNPGRCHDQGPGGLQPNSPQGGLEIIDVTDPNNPVTIGLTSHIGEAHTVNVDPKRPHIAYAVTSDNVGVDAAGRRRNEFATNPGVQQGTDKLDLDGFEVVDLSSCMNFPPGTSLDDKRTRCRPQVYRYRYPSTEMSLGHTNQGGTPSEPSNPEGINANGVFGCHELEIYPNDRLTCGSGNAMIALDMRGAFNNNGTPTNFRDDRPNGTPLPCRERESMSAPPFDTLATVIDCVDGQGDGEEDLTVPNWLAAGAPSLQGVNWIGSAFHQGRESTTGAADPAFPSSEDIDFNHEAELTHSGRYVLSTDERGGGVLPPGASCSPGADNPTGNGGIHAYRVDALLRRRPADPNDAFTSYARNPQGGKAIYRAPVRTQPQASLCTAHVFQQIPGQNRIFMGWYSQGTQVLDFVEHANGRFEWREAGYFIPVSANEWVSHIFKVERNPDDTFTYYGAAADFNLGAAGRNAVDVFKVTLPAPPAPRGLQQGVGRGFDPRPCVPAPARASSGRISTARVGNSARRFRSRYLTRRRRGRVTSHCVRRSRGRFYVGSGRRGRINFVASTSGRIGTRRIRPGRRLRRARVSGVRRFAPRARGLRRVFIGTRTRHRRFLYGTRGRRVTFIASVSRAQARNRRALARRLRALRLVPR
ncbi:MAG TPA: hypothetical protein VHG69_08480 [Thermoleophilaceae bacterium]|nr:hypothetical protein [Thermoleophilaceae bacterium]